MKFKEDLILESLYTKVVSEAKAKHKSKKQVGYLLSDKVSPLSKKQKDKLKKELHTGKVKVDEEVEIVFDSYLNEWVLLEKGFWCDECKKPKNKCTCDKKEDKEECSCEGECTCKDEEEKED
jgi:hypothetical protein